jgi:hypothetical protein
VGSALYEIRVRGRLGDTVAQSFPGFEARAGDGETILRGSIRDQGQLHDVLEQIDGFGLELLEVRRVEPPPRDA